MVGKGSKGQQSIQWSATALILQANFEIVHFKISNFNIHLEGTVLPEGLQMGA